MSMTTESQIDNPGMAASNEDVREIILRQMTIVAQREAGMEASVQEFERSLFDTLLDLGKHATDAFLEAQGNGDQGETTQDKGQTVFRSKAPKARKLRTIFGQHEIDVYVYTEKPCSKSAIVLRPIDRRLQITTARYSPLLQEFSMLLCCEESFHSSVTTFERIFRQKLSVDTLETVSRAMGCAAGRLLEQEPGIPASEEGALLVVTGDGKGIPMVQQAAKSLSAFEEKPQRPGNRRMATLSAVYSTNPYVRTPGNDRRRVVPYDGIPEG